MNGFLLLIPFLLIRFVLLAALNKDAVKRAAHFPPISGYAILMYWIYQISNITIFIYLFFLRVNIDFSWLFHLGMMIYLLGLIFCTITISNFAHPSKDGWNCNGVYRYSRNPMYLSYFIIFLGCVLLTRSLLLCVMLVIFQVSCHWIILWEERWCIDKFKEVYKQYMKEVRRYI